MNQSFQYDLILYNTRLLLLNKALKGKTMSKNLHIFTVLSLTAAIIMMGFFIQNGLINLRASERHVEVKGLAEMDIDADIAVWDISFEVSNADLSIARAELEKNKANIQRFLEDYGIAGKDIKVNRLSAYSRKVQDQRVGNVTKFQTVYYINQTIRAQSENVQDIEKATQNTAKLIEKGIVLKNSHARFLFTKLNDVKPDMIARATKNAREAAARFANDSGSEVGSIVNARQGLFQILPRFGGSGGSNSTIEKKLRVITTINFSLNE